MNNKGAACALILLFMPIYYAVINVVFQFKTIDLLYLIVVFVVFFKYYIRRKA